MSCVDDFYCFLKVTLQGVHRQRQDIFQTEYIGKINIWVKAEPKKRNI